MRKLNAQTPILVLLVAAALLIGACGQRAAQGAVSDQGTLAGVPAASSEITIPAIETVSTGAEPAVTGSAVALQAPTLTPVDPQVPETWPVAPRPSVEGPVLKPAATTESTVVLDGNDTQSRQNAATLSRRAAVTLPTTEIVKVLTPSVVHISTELASGQLFGGFAPPSGEGTGLVLDLEGHILTNAHVIEGAQSITVTLHDGSNLPAEIVGRDLTTDLAVINVSGAQRLSPAALGDSSTLLVGEDVIAIGHALGLSGAATVSKGVVSALERSIDTNQNTTIIDLIQTDASINPGNSGGPLVNSSAEVIGINTAIIRGGQGIGFAININDVGVITEQLMEQGFVRRGYLGVNPSALTPQLSAHLGLDSDSKGILLRRVLPDTAAAAAGLEEGDIILSMRGEELRNNGELSKFLIAHQPGETVEMVFLRDGEEATIEVTLGERPDN